MSLRHFAIALLGLSRLGSTPDHRIPSSSVLTTIVAPTCAASLSATPFAESLLPNFSMPVNSSLPASPNFFSNMVASALNASAYLQNLTRLTDLHNHRYVAPMTRYVMNRYPVVQAEFEYLFDLVSNLAINRPLSYLGLAVNLVIEFDKENRLTLMLVLMLALLIPLAFFSPELRHLSYSTVILVIQVAVLLITLGSFGSSFSLGFIIALCKHLVILAKRQIARIQGALPATLGDCAEAGHLFFSDVIGSSAATGVVILVNICFGHILTAGPLPFVWTYIFTDKQQTWLGALPLLVLLFALAPVLPNTVDKIDLYWRTNFPSSWSRWSLKAQITSLETQVTGLETQITDLKNQVQSTTGDAKRLDTSIKEWETSDNTKSEIIERLRMSVNEASQNNTALNEQLINQKKDSEAELKERIQRIEEHHVKQLLDVRHITAKEIEQIQDDQGDVQKNLREAERSLRKRVRQLEKAAAARITELGDAAARIAELEDATAARITELQDAAARIGELEDAEAIEAGHRSQTQHQHVPRAPAFTIVRSGSSVYGSSRISRRASFSKKLPLTTLTAAAPAKTSGAPIVANVPENSGRRDMTALPSIPESASETNISSLPASTIGPPSISEPASKTKPLSPPLSVPGISRSQQAPSAFPAASKLAAPTEAVSTSGKAESAATKAKTPSAIPPTATIAAKLETSTNPSRIVEQAANISAPTPYPAFSSFARPVEVAKPPTEKQSAAPLVKTPEKPSPSSVAVKQGAIAPAPVSSTTSDKVEESTKEAKELSSALATATSATTSAPVKQFTFVKAPVSIPTASLPPPQTNAAPPTIYKDNAGPTKPATVDTTPYPVFVPLKVQDDSLMMDVDAVPAPLSAIPSLPPQKKAAPPNLFKDNAGLTKPTTSGATPYPVPAPLMFQKDATPYPVPAPLIFQRDATPYPVPAPLMFQKDATPYPVPSPRKVQDDSLMSDIEAVPGPSDTTAKVPASTITPAKPLFSFALDKPFDFGMAKISFPQSNAPKIVAPAAGTNLFNFPAGYRQSLTNSDEMDVDTVSEAKADVSSTSVPDKPAHVSRFPPAFLIPGIHIPLATVPSISGMDIDKIAEPKAAVPIAPVPKKPAPVSRFPPAFLIPGIHIPLATVPSISGMDIDKITEPKGAVPSTSAMDVDRVAKPKKAVTSTPFDRKLEPITKLPPVMLTLPPPFNPALAAPKHTTSTSDSAIKESKSQTGNSSVSKPDATPSKAGLPAPFVIPGLLPPKEATSTVGSATKEIKSQTNTTSVPKPDAAQIKATPSKIDTTPKPETPKQKPSTAASGTPRSGFVKKIPTRRIKNRMDNAAEDGAEPQSWDWAKVEMETRAAAKEKRVVREKIHAEAEEKQKEAIARLNAAATAGMEGPDGGNDAASESEVSEEE